MSHFHQYVEQSGALHFVVTQFVSLDQQHEEVECDIFQYMYSQDKLVLAHTLSCLVQGRYFVRYCSETLQWHDPTPRDHNMPSPFP